MKECRGANALPACLSAYAFGQCRLHSLASLLDVCAVTVHVQQSKWRRRFENLRELAAKECARIVRTRVSESLRDVIAVRSHRRPNRDASFQVRDDVRSDDL